MTVSQNRGSTLHMVVMPFLNHYRREGLSILIMAAILSSSLVALFYFYRPKTIGVWNPYGGYSSLQCVHMHDHRNKK